MSCPMCSGSDVTVWRRLSHRGRDMVWMRCRSCFHRYLDPIPPDMEIWYETDAYRQTTHRSADPLVNLNEETRRADRLQEWIYEVPGAHLDIGSSTGSLLKKVGAEVQVGVELSHNRRQLYPEMGITGYKSLRDVDGDYDLITCIQTLEHVIDPKWYLDWMSRRCKGSCIIEVPVSGIHYPHLHCFGVDVLSDMMTSLGFEVQTLEITLNYILLEGHI